MWRGVASALEGVAEGADLDQIALGVGDVAGALAPRFGGGGQHRGRAAGHTAVVPGVHLLEGVHIEGDLEVAVGAVIVPWAKGKVKRGRGEQKGP